jgi:3-methyladenine DNA glycosylase AlkD
MNLEKLKKELQDLADVSQAKALQRFFKTNKGEYGEGDIFLGIKVPVQRSVAKKYTNLNLNEIQELLDSKIHEHRLVALFILIDKYKKADKEEKREIVDLYLKNYNNINNWDLVDLSAPKILGDFLADKQDKSVLYEFAKSDNLWKKRIAVLATFAFIDEKQFKDALAISEIFLKDREKHDLIHKAVGWMLREIGKRNLEIEEEFLKKHYKDMPRTTLRYAIERFPEEKRKKYLRGEIE